MPSLIRRLISTAALSVILLVALLALMLHQDSTGTPPMAVATPAAAPTAPSVIAAPPASLTQPRPSPVAAVTIMPLVLRPLAMIAFHATPAVTSPTIRQTVPHKGLAAGRDRTPSIALVIDDCGLTKAATLGAIALPPAVTLSFLPYGPHARALAEAARAAGHDVLLHMPMQPIGTEDPGPSALTVDLPATEITHRVQAALAALPRVDGLNNHMGSRFTTDTDGLLPVMQTLQAHGLYFLDSKTSPRSMGVRAAQAAGVPALARDVFLDDDLTPQAIAAQLEETERVARRKGAAIAIGHPHPQTLAALNSWLSGLATKGIHLVRLNSLVEPPRISDTIGAP